MIFYSYKKKKMLIVIIFFNRYLVIVVLYIVVLALHSIPEDMNIQRCDLLLDK